MAYVERALKKLAKVKTADNVAIGRAQKLFHRLENIDPELQYYATYLEVKDYGFGATYYIPTDFVSDADPEGDLVTLDATFREVQNRTWFRKPTFVARGQARAEALPDALEPAGA